MKKPIISIKNLYFSYRDNYVLKNVNLDIFEGDFIGIIGPNGSGKTTFLKLLLGLLPPNKGEITIQKNIKVSYVPQVKNFNTVMNMPVFDVLTLPLKKSHLFSTYKPTQFFDEIIQILKIDAFLHSFFFELSGGQQQRVLIARSLLQKPQVLLLDEPNAGIDTFTSHTFYSILKQIYEQYNMTILMVTHDLNIIPTTVKSVACILDGEMDHHSEPKTVFDCPAFSKMLGSDLELLIHGKSIPHRVVKEHHKKDKDNV